MIHESAVVDPGARIGEGTRVWHWVHVSSNATIGQNCVLGQGVYVADDVRIGDNVRIQNNVSIYHGVTLEDDVFCGPSAVFTNVKNPRSAFPRGSDSYEDTVVRRGVTRGANATIVCGVELGEYAFVGAGAVVTRDVLAHALVVGTPARQIGWSCVCGERLGDEETVCGHCERKYSLHAGHLSLVAP